MIATQYTTLRSRPRSSTARGSPAASRCTSWRSMNPWRPVIATYPADAARGPPVDATCRSW